METISAIFFVTASEYPKLQKACPEDFPFTYEQFLERAEEVIGSLPKENTVIKINVDISEFLTWCEDNKVKPDNKARASYAAFLCGQREKPNKST